MRAAARPAAARPLFARPPAVLPCVPRRWLLPAAPVTQCNTAADRKFKGKDMAASRVPVVPRQAAVPGIVAPIASHEDADTDILSFVTGSQWLQSLLCCNAS
jgi:hypothetical protein